MKKKFILFGASGFVAKRHVQAIKNLKCDLVAVCDPHDNVGYLDSYFDKCEYFRTERELFGFLKKKRMNIDYASICSPNNKHFHHIKKCLTINITPICEKPLVINLNDYRKLELIEKKSKKKTNIILQLRLNNQLKKIKSVINRLNVEKKNRIDLTYITPRGRWYNKSWKSSKKQSGGIALNIGIHLFDLLIELFGNYKKIKILFKDTRNLNATIYFSTGLSINIFLSIDKKKLPKKFSSYRFLKINENDFELSKSFKDLHTKSYSNILNNKGFGIEEFENSLKLALEF